MAEAGDLDAMASRASAKLPPAADGYANGGLPPAPHGWVATVLHGHGTLAPAPADGSKPCSFTPHFVASAPRPGAVSAIASPAENYSLHSDAAAQKNDYAFPKLAVLGVAWGRGLAAAWSRPRLAAPLPRSLSPPPACCRHHHSQGPPHSLLPRGHTPRSARRRAIGQHHVPVERGPVAALLLHSREGHHGGRKRRWCC